MSSTADDTLQRPQRSALLTLVRCAKLLSSIRMSSTTHVYYFDQSTIEQILVEVLMLAIK